MLIALDYDDTYTRDEELWCRFIKQAESCGHQVIIVTSRKEHGSLEDDDPIDLHIYTDLVVIFCNHNLKRQVCEKRGYKVDVWIDDKPGSIEETK